MGSYRPDVCVIQCGADSLAKDRLGHQNLTIKGHADCVKWMMGYGTPIVFLGGGGYTIENVSRCWAYETSVILGNLYNLSQVNPSKTKKSLKKTHSLTYTNKTNTICILTSNPDPTKTTIATLTLFTRP
jgi:acetoin utilization deacetylase AcuC-like enzyme